MMLLSVLPDSWRHLAPPAGGQGGEQPLVLAEHQHISEAGVGQSGSGSADTEQIVAQDHRSSCWYRGAFRKRLICSGERRGEVVQREFRKVDALDRKVEKKKTGRNEG